MKIHEFQAKMLLGHYGIPIPRGQTARTDEEALRVARQLGEGPFVLKAQIHAGGRGKAGGIRVVDSIADVDRAAREMLGKTLVTTQTGEEGKPVRTLLIEEAVNVSREVYIGILIDRDKACPVILASAEGGVEIERLARERPDRVIAEVVDPSVGLRPFQANRIFYALGLDGSLARPVMASVMGLYRLFVDKDLSLCRDQSSHCDGGRGHCGPRRKNRRRRQRPFPTPRHRGPQGHKPGRPARGGSGEA
jgi:succinyl-CoA synthetase beta subunit